MGREAEELVARRLADSGWQILERNARTRHGELDIVARDRHTLVFIEVKAGRRGTAIGPLRPVLAVDARKQQQIRRLAAAWLAERRDAPQCRTIRFDVVGVSFDRGRPIEVEHIRNAF
jgi:putative endonuclease